MIHVDDADLDPQNLVPAIKAERIPKLTFDEQLLNIDELH